MTRCDTSSAPPPPPSGDAGGVEDEDNIASAVVTQLMVDGIAGHTTWRVAVHVSGGDALNVYTIYGQAGSSDHPMEIPAAHQVAQPYGQSVGGVNPAFFAISAESEYDSWLTVGDTTGSASISSEISSVGIPWEEWNEDSGLHITDGAVFWMDPANGPTTADKDPIVMQLTVPTGCSFHGAFNAQGHTRPGSIDGNWDARNIQFHGGPGGECQQARAPPPPPPPPPPPRDLVAPGSAVPDVPDAPPPPPVPHDDGGGDGGDGGGSGLYIVIGLVVIGAGAAVAKKKQEGGGSATPADGGIYAKDIGDSDL